jgi:hypothetical protein
MKSDDVKRAFRSNRHERSLGDAPSLGRVPRIAGSGRPKGAIRRRPRGGRVSQTSRFTILSWSIGVGVVAVAGIGAAIFMWLRLRMGEVHSTQQSRRNVPEMVVRVASKFPSPPEAEALGLVNRALVVRDPAMVPAYFRMGAASPETIIGLLQGLEAQDGKSGNSRWLGSMDANGLSMDGVLVPFEKEEEEARHRLALLTPDAAGVWKIDFEAFARVVEPSWQELLERGAAEAKVRVHLAADSYYNGPFKDDKEWICYGMGSPDIDEVLIGYCRAGSPQEEAIRWMFSKGEKLNRATLQIRRVEGASAKQFEITRVLAEDWVSGDKPFDEGFN